MRVRRLTIQNFRGIANGTVDFAGNTLLVGGNNVGKSTVCEALDLVLGPERLSRRPVVDEHDFYNGRYLDAESKPVEIRVEATLVDLSEEAQRRFMSHLRRWDETKGTFVDAGDGDPEDADADGTLWALPVLFIGRYDAEEDDFVGGTFFAHPEPEEEQGDDSEDAKLGGGLRQFGRDQKRLCGFLFLRALRTGSRALSLQRGSLLDTVLRVPGSGLAQMWADTLRRLRELDPAVGEIAQLKQIRDEIQSRMGRFVKLAEGDDATAFFASDLTREHLREVVRLFIAAEPSDYLVPFQRLGAGSINLLVFALLTFIADLKVKHTVIFAMEEPEIALPPHTQRRVTRFVLGEMGQTIVTSHSPYVIAHFEPEQIVMLERSTGGALVGRPINLHGISAKTFKAVRVQFAEAILSRAVLVVEGATEVAIFAAASEMLEEALETEAYTHLDFVGVTVFAASGDRDVPKFAPVFKGLGKHVFGFYDKLKAPADPTLLASFDHHWESAYKGAEDLLVAEMPVAALRRFLEAVKDRSDYPPNTAKISAGMNDADVRKLAWAVLVGRKGNAFGYATLLVRSATKEELPKTIMEVLLAIHAALSPPPTDEGTQEARPEGEDATA
jgi:putative ATP-dependent endonuclease of OLD family